MPETDNKFQQLRDAQYAFAAHLRDPELNAAPADVDDRRMDVYRNLFFNNVVKFLGGYFPITRDILGQEHWREMVRDFYRDHESHSPLFADMPREFLAYLSDEREPRDDEPPFLYEFAHYEWVEGGILIAPDGAERSIDSSGDLLEGRPALVEPAWLLSYHFAVNEINRDNQPEEPADAPLHYIVYRSRDEDVKFVRLNIVSARLFELLQQEEPTGRAALQQIAVELGHSDPEAVISGGANILQQWRDSGIVLGTVKH